MSLAEIPYDPDVLHDAPTTTRSLERVAVNLCAAVLLKSNIRFVISLDELMTGSALPPGMLGAAIDLAVQLAWLRCGKRYVQLRAAGIFVAKDALDLPR